MVADESALVLVLPDDDVETIIAKVQHSGATTVQLLVPDGTTVLHNPHSIEQLRRSAESSAIDLLVITSDEQTLDAARLGQIETVGVSGTRVTLPADLPRGNGGAETLVEPVPVPPAEAQPEPAHHAPVVEPSDDDDIFAALDELSDTMNQAPPRGASREEYDAFAAELDEWGDVSSGRSTPARSEQGEEYDVLAAELDEWGDLAAGHAPSATAEQPERAALPPRPRIRAEDIELTEEEKQRASGMRGTGRRARGKSAWGSAAPTERRGDEDEYDLGAAAPRRSRRSWLIIALPILLIVLLVTIVILLLFGGDNAADAAERSGPLGGLLALGNQATVVVQLPVPPAEEQPFETQSIFLIPPTAEATGTAVQAEPLSVAAEYAASGQVTEETQAPASTARGTVTIYSQNTQPITLPQGTEFLGVNPQGQEVRFTSDAPVTIPPATTARQGAQIITTLGQAQVEVTAVAPGSASNIEANTITQMVVPGQPPIAVNAGALLVEHGPIGGGTEQAVRIVKESDVQQVLGEALTGLDNTARQMLRSAADGQGLVLEETTISPRRNVIFEDESYELQVVPPIGETVDPADPRFTVSVRATFDALATPPGRPLQNQLQEVVANQLAASDAIPAGTAPGITDWNWDGSRLTVDGVLRPTGEEQTLDAQTRAAILESIKGKSLPEARAALDYFVQEGIISDYVLPDVETLPRWGFLLNLKVEPGNVQAQG